MTIIKKVLVVNRGEIAVRIMRSCREMGIKTVAVFSETDRNAMHVRYANEAYFIGPSPSTESYLSIEKIIEVAKRASVDAIHPGYGFLSENANFSRICNTEGIIFIGPGPDAISTMGDKISARLKMLNAGVPVVPGTTKKLRDINEAVTIIKDIGLPVMIKASAGGGGKGMRLVNDESEIFSAVSTAKSEALSAFGDDSVYIEKYIKSPHHVEFQILADKFGNTIHLFERDCSVQRRHQKVIEETPSPLLDDKIRTEMGMLAIEAAKAVNYYGAGTIEFIVDDNLNYYFLEMNTRLQVEHPITERVIGIDLVKEQINIANGLKLSYSQKDIITKGHSIECRIYAEDPPNNFMPSPGIVTHISEPHGFGVRCDGYVYEGYEIPVFYDPLISKLIVWGNTRDEAIQRMKRALYEYKIVGVKTNIPFLETIMDVPDFISGKYDTHFIEKNNDLLFSKQEFDKNCEDMAIITAFFDYTSNIKDIEVNTKIQPLISKWKDSGRIKGTMRY